MFNFKSFRIPSLTAITASILLLAGCGGGGGGGVTFPTPTLPGDAVVFDDTNAKAIADAALASGDNLGTATAKNTESQFSIQDAIKLVSDQIRNRDRSSPSVVTGVTQTESCPSGGTITINYSGTATSESGTITFNACNFFDDVIINGSFSYNASFNDPVLTFNGGGNLSFTIVAQSANFTMVMNFSETINLDTGVFTSSENYSVTGLPVGNFLVTTTIPFQGNFNLLEIYSGQLLIQGGNNILTGNITQIRITVIAINMVSIELDDGSGSGFVPIQESPIPISP